MFGGEGILEAFEKMLLAGLGGIAQLVDFFTFVCSPLSSHGFPTRLFSEACAYKS